MTARSPPTTRDTAPMQELAEHLVGNAATASRATFPAIDKLRPHLTTLMGKVGFRALLSRALVLACADVPWLGSVKIGEDGMVKGLDVSQAQLGATDLRKGRVALLARLLGLLDAFIGRSLTLSLVREIWPNISLKGLPLDQEPNDGKTD
jgi:hypothetical protein